MAKTKQGPAPGRHRHLWHAHACTIAEIDGDGSKALDGNVDASVRSPHQQVNETTPRKNQVQATHTSKVCRPHGGSQPMQGKETQRKGDRTVQTTWEAKEGCQSDV